MKRAFLGSVIVVLVVTTASIIWLRDIVFAASPSVDEWREDIRPFVQVSTEGSSPRPVVFLMHGCGGEKPWLRDLRLAHYSALGYYAVSIDSLSPRAADPAKVCGGTQLWAGERLVDLATAIDLVSEDPLADLSRYAVIGYSHGAWAVLETYTHHWDEYTSHVNPPAAVVAYYPFCEWPNRALNSWERDTPLLSLLAELDSITAVQPCLDLFNRHRDTTVINAIVYPGVKHGFDVPDTDDWPDHYNAEADAEALNEVEKFLASHLLN